MTWLHWLNPLNWHWHHGEGYVVGTGVGGTIVSALAAGTATTAVLALVTICVAIYSAYRGERNRTREDNRKEQALDDIQAANSAAIALIKAGRTDVKIPFPQYLPPAPAPDLKS